MNWLEQHLSGYAKIGPVTIYGFNAMHVAAEIKTRWGYVCFHPLAYCFGKWWPWYFYISPNATPQKATFAVGPGVDPDDKARAKLRSWRHAYRRMLELELGRQRQALGLDILAVRENWSAAKINYQLGYLDGVMRAINTFMAYGDKEE